MGVWVCGCVGGCVRECVRECVLSVCEGLCVCERERARECVYFCRKEERLPCEVFYRAISFEQIAFKVHLETELSLFFN